MITFGDFYYRTNPYAKLKWTTQVKATSSNIATGYETFSILSNLTQELRGETGNAQASDARRLIDKGGLVVSGIDGIVSTVHKYAQEKAKLWEQLHAWVQFAQSMTLRVDPETGVCTLTACNQFCVAAHTAAMVKANAAIEIIMITVNSLDTAETMELAKNGAKLLLALAKRDGQAAETATAPQLNTGPVQPSTPSQPGVLQQAPNGSGGLPGDSGLGGYSGLASAPDPRLAVGGYGSVGTLGPAPGLAGALPPTAGAPSGPAADSRFGPGGGYLGYGGVPHGGLPRRDGVKDRAHDYMVTEDEEIFAAGIRALEETKDGVLT